MFYANIDTKYISGTSNISFKLLVFNFHFFIIIIFFLHLVFFFKFSGTIRLHAKVES